MFHLQRTRSLLLQRRHRFQKLDHKRGEKLLEAVLGERLEDMEWKRRRVYYTALRYVKHLKEELLTPSEASFDFVQAKYGIEAPSPRRYRGDAAAHGTDDDSRWISRMDRSILVSSPIYSISYLHCWICRRMSGFKP